MANILVKGVNWIGDSLFMTPALSALRKGFPNSHISLLINPWVSEVFDGNPDVDETIIYDEKGKEKTLWGKIRFIQSLRNRNFDIGIIMQPRSYQAALFVYFSGIPERIGYSHSLRNLLLTRKIKFPRIPVHNIDMFLNIVLSLGVAPARKEPYLPTSPEADAWADGFLEERGIESGELLIAINPGAFKQSKRWPEPRYAELSDILIREFGAKVIIFYGPGEDEIVERVLSLMKEKTIIARTGIKELAALSRRCKLFVSNDTGPMHVAAASGVPVIALFGPADPKRSRPWGKNHVVIRKDLPCSPCSRRVCKQLTCMKSISVEDVLKAVREQLRRIEKLDWEHSHIREVGEEIEQEDSSQFEKVVKGKAVILVKDKYKDQVLSQGMALSTKIREGLYPGASLFKGRSIIPCVPIKGSKERMIIKHYEHGGLFRKITRDIFLGNSRPFRELAILEVASRKGVPVPQVLAARVDRILGPFYRGEIAYKEIPDSSNLLEYLNRLNQKPLKEKIFQKREIINSLAEVIKKMHTLGIYHGDLNVKNVLIQNVGKKVGVYLVDFDCSKIKDSLTLRDRLNNLNRFHRSCQKWKAPITATDKLRFFLAYSKGDKLLQSNLRKYARQCSRFHWGHRIYWKLFG